VVFHSFFPAPTVRVGSVSMLRTRLLKNMLSASGLHSFRAFLLCIQVATVGPLWGGQILTCSRGPVVCLARDNKCPSQGLTHKYVGEWGRKQGTEICTRKGEWRVLGTLSAKTSTLRPLLTVNHPVGGSSLWNSGNLKT
jgi:hypothetical protein